MENKERRTGSKAPLSLREVRKFYGTTNPGAAERTARLLNGLALAINAVNPRDSEDTRLDGYFNLSADVKAVEVVGIDGDSFDFLAGSPGLHDQAAGSSDQTFHQKFTFNALWNIDRPVGRIEFAVQENREGENPG